MMWKTVSKQKAILFSGLLLFSAPSLAQDIPSQLPSSADPSLAFPEDEIPTLGMENFSLSVDIPNSHQVPEGYADETLTFNDLILEGVSVYDQATLRSIFAEDLGKTITFRRFFELANLIEQKYRKDGYVLAFTYFPEQSVDLEDGRFRLIVVESYVDQIEIEADDPALAERLRTLLAPIKQARPFNSTDLERRLLLADDLAGVKISSILQPAKEQQGASDLIVKASLDPVNFYGQIDNYGSKYRGPWRASASITLNSAFDLGEKLTLSVGSTKKPKELKYVAFNAELPLWDNSSWLALSGSHSWSEPGYDLSALEAESVGHHVNLAFHTRLIRSRFENLTLSTGFKFTKSATNLFGEKFSRDRIRTFNLATTYEESGFLNGGTLVNLHLIQGLPDILHATDPVRNDMSRSDSDMDFTKLTLLLTRNQRLWNNLSMLASAKGQWSTAPLPSAEEFKLGGRAFGRGYNRAEISGDHGYAFTAELRWDQTVDWSLIETIQPYLFWDWGSAWQMESRVSLGGQSTLSSGGGGFRARLYPGISFDMEYAQPLTRPRRTEANEMAYRLFTRLSIEY